MISVEFRDWLNDKVMLYLPRDGVRTGNTYNCRCPICGDSKKNKMKKRGYYFFDKGYFFCHNQCGNISGMKLLELLSGADYQSLKQEYVKMMYDGKHFNSLSSNNFSDGSNSVNLFKLQNIVNSEWKKPLSEKACEYLKNRMVLNAPFLKEPLYSYYRKNGDEYILIPWKINDVDCYFQLNDFEKHNPNGMKYIFPKNKDKMIYGLDNIDISFPYIMCFEGCYDSLFVKNSICLGGKFLTKMQEDIIRKRFPNHKIVLAFDNDEPAFKSVAKILADRKKMNNYMFFKWFSDDTKEKDINDFVLSKKNPNLFTDRKVVESCIVDPVIMKLWMMRKGYLK